MNLDNQFVQALLVIGVISFTVVFGSMVFKIMDIFEARKIRAHELELAKIKYRSSDKGSSELMDIDLK